MPLDLGDLDGKMKLFETAARSCLAQLGAFEQDDLDELVTDALSGQASQAVNDGANYNEAHDDAEARASDINNRGADAQIAALMALGWTSDEIGSRLTDMPTEPSF